MNPVRARPSSPSRKRWTFPLLAGGTFILSVGGACAIGAYPVAFTDVLRILLTGGASLPDDTAVAIVWKLRLSRALLAFLAGCGLAASGVVFQGILRNPLADPFTLGVSGGAAFGAALAITLGLAAPLYPLAALAGAGGALAFVLLLATGRGTLRRETLVLAGVVVSAFLAALIALVKALDEDSVAGIVFWIMGSFQGRGWHDMPLLLPGLVLGSVPVVLLVRELDVLSLGDTEARHLGVNVPVTRLWLLLGASALAASCVAVSGIIGFVGLVVPHLVRLLIGGNHKPLLPASAFAGGILLLWSDVAARSLLPDGVELPVGVITALLGGPFFCYLLRRSGQKERGQA
ncbi:MAG: iron ABC transporter permease [Deltaproteobacteria bacterium]|nr:iron ABC transporter permease [Deltaproteobacteria bacterium]